MSLAWPLNTGFTVVHNLQCGDPETEKVSEGMVFGFIKMCLTKSVNMPECNLPMDNPIA